jgi:hypothetical protein
MVDSVEVSFSHNSFCQTQPSLQYSTSTLTNVSVLYLWNHHMSARVLIASTQALHHSCIPSRVESPRTKLCSGGSIDSCRNAREVSGGFTDRRNDKINFSHDLCPGRQFNVRSRPEQGHRWVLLASRANGDKYWTGRWLLSG